jgi:hypothetical protein
MLCAPEIIFCGTVAVGSHFNVLSAQIHFRQYRGRRDPISYFARTNSFSAVPWASDPSFRFFAPEHIFGGADGVGSRIHFLRSRTRFLRYRVRCVPFSCFVLPDSFFCGTEGARSSFHVFQSWTSFWRCGGLLVSFSCFALPDTFSTVPKASGPVFLFCTPELIFGGTKGVGSRFHVFSFPNSFLAVPRASCFAIPGTFPAVRRRPISISCFALPDSFSAIPRASVPVFMFCAPGLIFSDAECVGSCFDVLRARTHFLGHRGRPISFSCFSLPDMF